MENYFWLHVAFGPGEKSTYYTNVLWSKLFLLGFSVKDAMRLADGE